MSIETILSKFGKSIDIFITYLRKCTRFSFAKLHEGGRIKVDGVPKMKHISGAISPYAILIFDSFVAFLSIFISIHLRVGMDFLDYSPIYIIKNMFVFGLVSSSVFLWIQTHQFFWRYTTIEDMVPIFLSVILSNILFFPLMTLMNREDFFPYSVLIINLFVLSIMLVTPRFLSRILYNQKIKKMKRFSKELEQQAEVPRILLVGNSASIEVFLREVVSNNDVSFNFEPVGILTFDREEVGHIINGIPIVGEIRDIHNVMRTLNNREKIFPKQIILTEKALPENAKRFLIRYVQENGMLLMHVIHQYTFNSISE
jgi:O-antigen biosynthesis protein WbqV